MGMILLAIVIVAVIIFIVGIIDYWYFGYDCYMFLIVLSPILIGVVYNVIDNYYIKNMVQCTFSNYNNNEIVRDFIDNNNDEEQFICISYKKDDICIFKENQYDNLLNIVSKSNRTNKIYIDIEEKTFIKSIKQI